MAEVEAIRKGMPDTRFEVQVVIAEGDKVVAIQRFSGSLTEEARGIKPAGQKVDLLEADIYQLKGGRIVELWGFLDTAKMARQLGMNE
jgi:predicted ester cyclase